MGDPTQPHTLPPPGEPATNEPTGDPPRLPAADLMPPVTNPPDHADTRGISVGDVDDDAAAEPDPDALDRADATIDEATHEELIENLLARVASIRQRWAAIERERHALRRAILRVERERDEHRAAHTRALRRAEAAELRLAEVQARITALEDSLQQRRRDRIGSAKLPGAHNDVGQDFK